MNTGLRLDYLSIMVDGDEEFKNALLGIGTPCAGVPMYLHGRECRDHVVYVQDEYNISYPVGMIRFNHALCWSMAWGRIGEIVLLISRLAGFRSYHINRVDVGTIIDWNLVGLGESWIVENRRGKCRRNSIEGYTVGGETKTIYMGSGRKMRFRVYDKRAEMEKQVGNNNKLYVWDEMKDFKVANTVEIQCMRAWLKDFGIETIDDLFWCLKNGRLWQYCTRDFLRFDCDGWDEISSLEVKDIEKKYEGVDEVIVRECDEERVKSILLGCLRTLCREVGYFSTRVIVRSMMEDLEGKELESESRFRVVKVS